MCDTPSHVNMYAPRRTCVQAFFGIGGEGLERFVQVSLKIFQVIDGFTPEFQYGECGFVVHQGLGQVHPLGTGIAI